jgi:hypothetical protein
MAPVSTPKLTVACGWVGVITLALGLWTSSAGSLPARHPLPEGVKSPILALELIRDPQLLDQIARPDAEPPRGDSTAPPPRHERDRLRRAVTIDFGFIVAYATFLSLVGYLVWTVAIPPFGGAGIIVVMAVIAAALFDVRENLAMLSLLAGGSAGPRSVSLVKWRLLFVAVTASAALFVTRNEPPLRRAMGILGGLIALVAGIEGLYGAFKGDDKLIEAASGRLGGAFLVTVVYLLTYGVLRDGLLLALNKLAEWKLLAWLTNWPTADDNETIGLPVVDDSDPPPLVNA